MQRTFSTLSKSQPVGIKHLRQAWNCFARLLDINWQSCYLCPVCGTSPKTIVCDGTLIGFRKDFLSESYSPKSESIKEIQTTTKDTAEDCEITRIAATVLRIHQRQKASHTSKATNFHTVYTNA